MKRELKELLVAMSPELIILIAIVMMFMFSSCTTMQLDGCNTPAMTGVEVTSKNYNSAKAKKARAFVRKQKRAYRKYRGY